MREHILQRVKEEERTSFVDYLTLSSSLLFSGNHVTSFDQLTKHGFYNTLRQEPYRADGYLEGVEIVRADYRELFEQYRHAEGVVFIVDPPYLSTEVGAYKCYWKLGDYLDVLKVLDGQSYVYFSSTKSQVVELMDWGDDLDIFRQPVRRCRTPRAKRHDQQTGPLHGYHDVQIDALVKRQEPSGEGPDMHPAPLCTLWGALKNKARIRMKWRFLLNLYN